MIQGDTDLIATGAGTGGSSSITCGGASVAGASRKLADNLKSLAADALEAAEADLEIADGAVRIAGTDRAVSFAELAARHDARPSFCRRATWWDRRNRPIRTAPISPKSRSIRRPAAIDIVGYVVVDDFGVTSIRCCLPARSMAAPSRASARRDGDMPSMTAIPAN